MEFPIGSRVRITEDEDLLRTCHILKKELKSFFGTVVAPPPFVDEDSYRVHVNIDGYGSGPYDSVWFTKDCLELLHDSVTPTNEITLDSILESLYDHMHGKTADNLDTLLCEYKNLTGKNKPEFMK